MFYNLVLGSFLVMGSSVRALALFGHYDGLKMLGFGAQDLTSLGLGFVKKDGTIPGLEKTRLWTLRCFGQDVCE
jgi:hypothetical protein